MPMTNSPSRIGAALVVSFLAVGNLAGQSTMTAFVHFNVVPMTSDTVLRDRTVLVAEGKITAIGPAKSVHVPRGAVQVDGHGSWFLVPALADMHTHTTNPNELALFASHARQQ
jgi:imidazolonepropionase-like amidohydrolase